MQENRNNPAGIANRAIGRFVAENKKGVVALSLVCIMLFMWGKMLLGENPKSAEGTETSQRMINVKPAEEPEVVFIELPKVVGRNDILTRDFFRMDGKSLGQTTKVSTVSKDDDKDYIRRIARKLKLEAISLGQFPQTFINNKLLPVGGKLLVKDGANTYECEIVEIKQNTVLIRCKESEITLKFRNTKKNSSN